MRTLILTLLIATLVTMPIVSQIEIQNYGKGEKGSIIVIDLEIDQSHNHPVYAIWLENAQHEFVQTLYISQSIGKGVYQYGKRQVGYWEPGAKNHPATLPYWSHKRNILNEYNNYMPTEQHPALDAYTGATPKEGFKFYIRTIKPLKGIYYVYVEVNQPWDWNNYWNNAKYTKNKAYRTSAQPAVVYEAILNSSEKDEPVTMKVVGHSHYAGENGDLYTDTSTLTTALKIIKQIKVWIE